MPPKRNNKNRRRRKNNVIVKRVPRSLGPTFPNDMIAKHRWTQKFDLTISGATEDSVSSNSFNYIHPWNLYDPGGAVLTTGSAMFYDELKAHYSMYQVLGARVKVRFVNKCAGPIYVGCFRDTDTITSGWTMTSIREKGFGGKRQRICGALNSGREVTNFTEVYSLKKTLGVSSADVKADRSLYMNQDDSSIQPRFPSQSITFYSALVDKNLQEGDGKVEAYVEIDFTARWSDREKLADEQS